MLIFFETLFSSLNMETLWILLAFSLVIGWANRQLPKWKGAFGERIVKKILSTLGPDYRVYHNLYIPNEDYGMTQLDHVVVSRYGLHVVETKNYSGWIFGNDYQKYWTQVIYKKKQRMYNPIRQNYGHIQSIKSYLQDEELAMYSIIAFSSNAKFKFKEPCATAKVIHYNELCSTINEQQELLLSTDYVEQIKDALGQLIISDKKELKRVRKEHIKRVKSKQLAPKIAKKKVEKPARPGAEKKSIVQQNTKETCPRCDGNLVKRTGKHGAFIGCTKFPSCRYTKKLDK